MNFVSGVISLLPASASPPASSLASAAQGGVEGGFMAQRAFKKISQESL